MLKAELEVEAKQTTIELKDFMPEWEKLITEIESKGKYNIYTGNVLSNWLSLIETK